jgi:hypothetical protein
MPRRPSVLGDHPLLRWPKAPSGASLDADPLEGVRALLLNLRLLEGAGACELLSAGLAEVSLAGKHPRWWAALADSLRSYRATIQLAAVRGFAIVDEWSCSSAPGSDADLVEERLRLGAEHRRWFCEVTGGTAYIAWLSAYVAVAELDGERALSNLDRCSAIVREFIDVGEPAREASVYERLQSAADALAVFLALPQHPLSDMHRFALLPAPMRTGYGS